jgi:hypothetical protein
LAVGPCSVDVGFGFGFGGGPRFFPANGQGSFRSSSPFLLKNEVRRDNPAALASAAVFGGFTLGVRCGMEVQPKSQFHKVPALVLRRILHSQGLVLIWNAYFTCGPSLVRGFASLAR